MMFHMPKHIEELKKIRDPYVIFDGENLVLDENAPEEVKEAERKINEWFDSLPNFDHFPEE